MATSIITFTCWERDEPIEIQLEPEAILFKILPDNEVTFKGISLSDSDFEWSLRIGHKNQGIQLFPSECSHEIIIFENGVLLKDWYKYMR